jgi:hypothetical protein
MKYSVNTGDGSTKTRSAKPHGVLLHIKPKGSAPFRPVVTKTPTAPVAPNEPDLASLLRLALTLFVANDTNRLFGSKLLKKYEELKDVEGKREEARKKFMKLVPRR